MRSMIIFHYAFMTVLCAAGAAVVAPACLVSSHAGQLFSGLCVLAMTYCDKTCELW